MSTGGILGRGEEGMNSFLEAYEGDGQEGLASNVHTCRRTFVVIWHRGIFFFIHPPVERCTNRWH